MRAPMPKGCLSAISEETPFTEIQQAVLEVSIRLQKVGDQLADLSSGLPEPAEKFDIKAELRGVLECVRNDLLADAVNTLRAAATRDEAGFRGELQKRLVLQGGEK
jgi:hypothetical protein